MPAFDLIKGISQSTEKIVVGMEDGPVHAEFDHRLRFADGRDLAPVIEVQQPLCRVRPLHHRAQARAVLRVEDRRCDQIERAPSHLDASFVRFAKPIEHPVLIRGILVKKVEASADQLGSAEIRQVFPYLTFRFRK